ncbi:MAG: hypothetical protein ACSLEN_01160 [Candidatus Malihini olakiniferum]
MYEHNKYSITFMPWNDRYLNVYSFSAKKEKTEYNEPVHLFDKNMQELNSDTVPYRESNEDKIEFMKNLLKHNGRFLDITIGYYPKVNFWESNIIKQRILSIDVVFLEEDIISIT